MASKNQGIAKSAGYGYLLAGDRDLVKNLRRLPVHWTNLLRRLASVTHDKRTRRYWERQRDTALEPLGEGDE